MANPTTRVRSRRLPGLVVLLAATLAIGCDRRREGSVEAPSVREADRTLPHRPDPASSAAGSPRDADANGDVAARSGRPTDESVEGPAQVVEDPRAAAAVAGPSASSSLPPEGATGGALDTTENVFRGFATMLGAFHRKGRQDTAATEPAPAHVAWTAGDERRHSSAHE